ncbi:helix-turn-helix transcriptional regulator [Candidatus Methylacidiphilum infernorum]|uniref:Helix-turn-helix transcriptional regulator n=1 Tax=Candidatus Methylacidiphilum infernorum TaxID=511746 RepID=A0ABX7PT09_9BACT|nr:helix-turn-helix transcriptional regulator [Candidatus Methylacidiphilum infernorum]QSR86104.1 helix-turn-helix transcriptional regulator [Candidatus Methylacidiphilum infernorum]
MSKITTIAKSIKKYRKEKGLSQDKLARLDDVSHATIVKIESGWIQSPTINTVQKIAKAQNIGLKDLMK